MIKATEYKRKKQCFILNSLYFERQVNCLNILHCFWTPEKYWKGKRCPQQTTGSWWLLFHSFLTTGLTIKKWTFSGPEDNPSLLRAAQFRILEIKKRKNTHTNFSYILLLYLSQNTSSSRILRFNFQLVFFFFNWWIVIYVVNVKFFTISLRPLIMNNFWITTKKILTKPQNNKISLIKTTKHIN